MTYHIEYINITRKRGDDFPIQFTLTDDANPPLPINITGFTFKMTIDPSKTPTDISANILTLTGVIVTAVSGIFEFRPTAGQMDITPDVYYFDVEMVDGGPNIRTIVEGKFIIEQDIVK